MRTGNWIVYAAAVALSVGLLWLWYYLGFNRFDSPTDLALSIAWWAVAVGAVALIAKVESTRRRRVRTCYVSPRQVFNAELGSVELAPGAPAVDTVQTMLEALSYDFHIEDLPSESDAHFIYVVRTRKFETKQHEVKTWTGEVALTARPDDDPIEFTSREELQAILEGAPIQGHNGQPVSTGTSKLVTATA